jgi:hypothetical protein
MLVPSSPNCDIEFLLVRATAVLYRIAEFTTACHWTLCSDKSIHFTPPTSILRLILILSCPSRSRQEAKLCQERVTSNGKAFISISVADQRDAFRALKPGQSSRRDGPLSDPPTQCRQWTVLWHRFSNFFQVVTTFISQNVLQTTLLLSPFEANLSFFL